jgi:hypothetical protein
MMLFQRREHLTTDRKKYIYPSAILLLGLGASLPLILWGLHYTTHDGAWHYLYYQSFSAQLAAGEIYPRWAADLNSGFGSPIFFYYPPLVYYITSAFSWVPLNGWHHLGFTMAVGIAASGLTAYYWLRGSYEPKVALITALVFMVLPYHTSNAYLRGALAETTAFVWMPLVLMFVQRMARGSRRAFIGVAFAFGLLMATHLLTAMIFAPVALGYAIFVERGNGGLRNTGLTAIAFVVAAAIAAVYIFPAITMQGFIHFDEMKSGTLSYEKWFVGPGIKVDGTPRYFWLVVLPGTLALSSALLIWSKRGLNLLSGYWAFVCATSLFMTLWISAPLWEILPVLHVLQFPWRFHVLLSIAVLPVVAASLSSLTRPFRWQERVFVTVLSALCVTFVVDLAMRVNKQYSEREPTRERILALRSDWRAFFPKAVPLDPRLTLAQPEANVESLFERMGWDGSHGPFVRVASGDALVEVVRREPRMIGAAVSANEASEIEFARFYFVGLTGRIVETGETVDVSPSELGMIRVAVPPGKQTIEVALGKTTPEAIGEPTSLVSISLSFLVLGLLFYRGR